MDEQLRLGDQPYATELPPRPAPVSGDAAPLACPQSPSCPARWGQWHADFQTAGHDDLAVAIRLLAQVVADLDAHVLGKLDAVGIITGRCVNCCEAHCTRLIDESERRTVKVLRKLWDHCSAMIGEAEARVGAVVVALGGPVGGVGPAVGPPPVVAVPAPPAPAPPPAALAVAMSVAEQSQRIAQMLFSALPITLPEQLVPVVSTTVALVLQLLQGGATSAPAGLVGSPAPGAAVSPAASPLSLIGAEEGTWTVIEREAAIAREGGLWDGGGLPTASPDATNPSSSMGESSSGMATNQGV